MPGDRSSVSGRMEGGGYYTAHSQAQRAFGALALDWLAIAATEIEAPRQGVPFVIADFGAAGGGSSLEPVRRALAARAAPGPALIVHTDIPSNDFSALFELIETSPESYAGVPDVYPYAAGRSFYESLFPAAFLSLGWSAIAVHWLSNVAEPIADHIYCTFATGDVMTALKRQSARDWRDFLGHRAVELRSTGRLIVAGGANSDDGVSGAEGLMDAANESMRSLVAAGVLSQSEYQRMTIPTWNRTLAEFTEPFTQGELAGRLELRRAELHTLPDPFLTAFEQDGDVDRYADSVVGSFRAAFEESLWVALNSERDVSARTRIRAAFAADFTNRVAADPRRCAAAWRVVILDIGAL